MSSMHPHWHDTSDDTERVAPQGKSGGTHIPVNDMAPVSRLPGAILGILCVILAGVVYMQGFGNLRSMLLGDSAPGVLEVHLSGSGASPSDIQMRPGQTVAWINDSTADQLITGDGVLGSDGKVMSVPVIPAGARQEFTISTTQPAGSYRYGSLTGPIRGTIMVSGDPILPNTSSSEATSVPGLPAWSGGNGGSGSDLASGSGAIGQDTLIPRNPYTVSRHLERSLDANGQPWPKPGTTTSTLHGAATVAPQTPRPLTQPESGPELWIVYALAGVFVLFAAKRSTGYEL